MPRGALAVPLPVHHLAPGGQRVLPAPRPSTSDVRKQASKRARAVPGPRGESLSEGWLRTQSPGAICNIGRASARWPRRGEAQDGPSNGRGPGGAEQRGRIAALCAAGTQKKRTPPEAGWSIGRLLVWRSVVLLLQGDTVLACAIRRLFRPVLSSYSAGFLPSGPPIGPRWCDTSNARASGIVTRTDMTCCICDAVQL